MQHVKGTSLGVLSLAKLRQEYTMYCDKKDDNRCGAFKNAQKTIGGKLHKKEKCMEGIQWKQIVMDDFSNLKPNNQLNHLD